MFGLACVPCQEREFIPTLPGWTEAGHWIAQRPNTTEKKKERKGTKEFFCG